MSESPSSPAAKIETLKELYAALNRNDIPALMKIFDPQIERVEPADSPQGGDTYHGLEALTEHVAKTRANVGEGACEPEHFIVAGDRVIVYVHVHVKLKHETDWREGHIADVYTFRNGKVIYWRTFIDRQQALEWVGVNALDAKASGK